MLLCGFLLAAQACRFAFRPGEPHLHPLSECGDLLIRQLVFPFRHLAVAFMADALDEGAFLGFPGTTTGPIHCP